MGSLLYIPGWVCDFADHPVQGAEAPQARTRFYRKFAGVGPNRLDSVGDRQGAHRPCRGR